MKLPLFTALLAAATSATSFNVQPFEVQVSSQEIERMQKLVENTRLPQSPAFTGAAEGFGLSRDKLEELRQLWVSDYDWSSAEAELNRYVR